MWTGGFDGAARPGNPGWMSAGAWLADPDGRVVWTWSAALGWGTANRAEWAALCRLLAEAAARQAYPLAVQGDSQLVVAQFTGRWAVTAPALRPYWARARALAAGRPVTVTWVPRAANTRADTLSRTPRLPPPAFDPARLTPAGPGRYIAHGTHDYLVDVRARTCTCPAFRYRPGPCKHLQAALKRAARRRRRRSR